jgi:hypothetical protein
MSELEAEAVKSGKEMENKELTPKRRKTMKDKGAKGSETNEIEVDALRQVQWQEEMKHVCDRCQKRKNVVCQ